MNALLFYLVRFYKLKTAPRLAVNWLFIVSGAESSLS